MDGGSWASLGERWDIDLAGMHKTAFDPAANPWLITESLEGVVQLEAIQATRSALIPHIATWFARA
jgi:hypothetical protein